MILCLLVLGLHMPFTSHLQIELSKPASFAVRKKWQSCLKIDILTNCIFREEKPIRILEVMPRSHFQILRKKNCGLVFRCGPAAYVTSLQFLKLDGGQKPVFSSVILTAKRVKPLRANWTPLFPEARWNLHFLGNFHNFDRCQFLQVDKGTIETESIDEFWPICYDDI